MIILYSIVLLLLLIVVSLWLFQGRLIGHLGEKHTIGIIKEVSGGNIFGDIYISGSHGVQQIDVIAITKKGILVIEKKTYIGLIVGTAYDKQWKIFVANGKKSYTMKNPLHQNFGHVQALLESFPEMKEKIHSLVIFGNNAKLGNKIPKEAINDRNFKQYYDNLPTLLNESEIEKYSEMIQNLNSEKSANKALHKSKIRQIRRKKEG